MAFLDLTTPNSSNFLSAGKDLQSIINKLITNQNLLKLLKYTTPDALSKPDLTPQEIKELINKNIKTVPKVPILEEEVGGYIIVIFDYFKPNYNNPMFRNNLIIFDVICQMDNWIMDDYMLRPYKIMHEIDSMFNETKLNGIGKVEFAEATSLVIDDRYAGYSLKYMVINDK